MYFKERNTCMYESYIIRHKSKIIIPLYMQSGSSGICHMKTCRDNDVNEPMALEAYRDMAMM